MHTSTEPYPSPSISTELSPKSKQNTALRAQDVRYVRFLLSPPPEKATMNSTRQQPRVPRESRVVLPTTPKEEEIKFGSSNTWGRNELKLLGVDFYMKRRINLNKVLRVRDSEWSPELRERIACGAKQLGSVDIIELNRGIIDIDEVRKKLAPDFVVFFTSLLDVISVQERKQRLKQASEQNPVSACSGSTVRKRPPQSPVASNPPKRTKEMNESSSYSEPKTPDRPSNPSNPDWTGGTATSKDEENTKMLLKHLLVNTMSLLEADFRRITWQRSGHRVELAQTQRDMTKFRLGMETITAINDGGLGLRYNIGDGPVDWQPGGIRPVLALEAKRRRSNKKDDIELMYEYAGQIFCEMLGQTCYSEFFENNQMEYQEAFIIHGSHSSVTIYYAKLPNTYLSEIAKHGAKYLQRTTFEERIHLRRTKKFRMQNTDERIELFELLAKLLWYLISGRSHVGYLFNHDDNPIHKIGQVIYESITVETPPAEDDPEEGAMSSFSEATEEDFMDEELEGDDLDRDSEGEEEMFEDY